MALKLHTTYPGRFDSPSENYPQGKWRNRSNSTAHDGGYLEEKHMNDIYGFFGALLRNAEMSPNGEVDTAKKSQFYDALVEVAKKAVGEEGYRKLDDNVFNGYLQVRSEHDGQGTGVFLQDADGTVRGQVVATDQGLQLTQYTEDGGLQTFTFPSEGGEVAIVGNLPYITPEMFGAKGDGVTNDLQAIQDCFHFAKENNLNVKFKGGKYRLSGGDDILVSTSVDFNNSELDITEYSGTFILSNTSLSVEDSENVRNLLTQKIPMLASQTSLQGVKEGLFVIYETDLPLYHYRGDIEYYREMFVTYNGGFCSELNQLELGADVTITSVQAFPISKPITFENVVFIEGEGTPSRGIIRISGATHPTLRDIYFKGGGRQLAEGTSRIRAYNVYGLIIKNVRSDSSYYTVDHGSVYSISLGMCLDTYFENIVFMGNDWGALTTNHCKNININNSKLSRIDAHTAFQGKVIINNTTVGNNGLAIVSFADITLNDCIFEYADGGRTPNFISLREDSGGWSTGTLTLNNCTLKGDSSVGPGLLYNRFIRAGGGDALPLKSPFSREVFTEINLNNLKVSKGLYLQPTRLDLIKVRSGEVLFPKRINMSQFKYDGGFVINLNSGRQTKAHFTELDIVNSMSLVGGNPDVVVLDSNIQGFSAPNAVSTVFKRCNVGESVLNTVNKETTFNDCKFPRPLTYLDLSRFYVINNNAHKESIGLPSGSLVVLKKYVGNLIQTRSTSSGAIHSVSLFASNNKDYIEVGGNKVLTQEGSSGGSSINYTVHDNLDMSIKLLI